MGGKTTNKAGYFDKLKGLLEEFKSVFIVEIDNVSSQQMHEIRLALRGQGVVLMGKNTMVCFFLTHDNSLAAKAPLGGFSPLSSFGEGRINFEMQIY